MKKKYSRWALILLVLVLLRIMIALPHRDGELYISSHNSKYMLHSILHPSEYSWFDWSDAPIFTFAFLIAYTCDIPFACAADTVLIPYDLIVGLKKGIFIQIVDDKGHPVPDATINGRSLKPFSGKSNIQGIYRVSNESSSIEWFSVSKSNYYDTWDYSGRRGELTTELVALRTNILRVVLKRIHNPIPMYAKQASVELPAASGSYGYDLMIGDLLKPYGKGEVADFIFHIAKEIKPYARNLDVSFLAPRDGIQRYDSAEARHRDGPRQSDFIFPYEAPESGYYPSLLEADVAADAITPHSDSQNRNYHIANYIFLTRTGNTTNGVYGRIFGPFGFIIRETSPIVQFTYYLNPSGTRNLEWDSARNLLINSKRNEYEPRAK